MGAANPWRHRVRPGHAGSREPIAVLVVSPDTPAETAWAAPAYCGRLGWHGTARAHPLDWERLVLVLFAGLALPALPEE